MKKSVPILATAVWAATLGLRAANPGDGVVVVYNTRVPESKGVAEYYAQRRQVPAGQVVGFPLSTNEGISRLEFRESLQHPLAQWLKKQKLWEIGPNIVRGTSNQQDRVEWKVEQSKIRYAVLCCGVPLRIERDPLYKEPGMESLRSELRRDEAAVDSELALLPLIEERVSLLGPMRNPVYTSTNEAALHPTNGVLLVARLDGPSASIARGLVDKALEAERDGLWGRAYFDLRNTTDPAYKVGDEWIRGAAEICRRLGFETVVDARPETFPPAFPMSQIAYYVGWYDGDVSGPFAQPVVEFMPGAFAYHVHSFSAATLRSASKHWAGPLLAKGATITMGCVAEPYLTGTPDLGVFTARLVYHGFTFGEAAYASQPVLSWQTTVVGDPLYRPFGGDADKLHRELYARDSQLIEWSWLRLANLNLAFGKPRAEVVALLEQVVAVKPSAVLMEKLGDLYSEQGKPSSAIHACRRALELGPSPQQRVRLLLTLAERQLGQEHTQEAYAAYQRLLKDCPHYPDKLGLYRKLLPLAQKLEKKAEAEEYQAEINRLAPPPKPPAEQKTAKPQASL